MTVSLDRERRERAIASIKLYCAEELECEVGDLKAGLLLDFFLTEIGPSIYNHAIADAQAYFQERVGDLDGVCFEPEFAFRKPGR